MQARLRFRTTLVAAACALLAAATHAQGQFPSRPIRLIVPFTAGGGTDILARALGQHFTATMKQNVIVDNRAGGNTIIGSELAANAAPDGHTLLVQINNLTALPALSPGKKVVSVDSFAPVTLVAVLPPLRLPCRCRNSSPRLMPKRAKACSSPARLATPLKRAAPIRLAQRSSNSPPVGHLGSNTASTLSSIIREHITLLSRPPSKVPKSFI